MTFDPDCDLIGCFHLGNRAKSAQECLLILISLVAPYAPKVPTLRKKIALKTPVYYCCVLVQRCVPPPSMFYM